MDDKPKLRPVDVFPVKSGRRTLVCIRDATGLSDRLVTASANVLPVLGMLDGKHDLLDIQAALTRQSGEIVFSDEIKKMLDVLDEALLLDGERFESHRRRIEKDFAASSVRKAMSAGTAYPEEPDKLHAFLDRLLADAGQKGETAPGGLRGIIAPHIDYHRGGISYARAFSRLPASEPPELFIILGTAHADTTERFALTRKDFQTPLGAVHTDSALVDELLRRSKSNLLADEFVHRGEHSVELELVFLQHVMQKTKRTFRILPILCGSFAEAMEKEKSPMALDGVAGLIAGLKRIVASRPRASVFLAAGADLSHIGPRFGGDTPVTKGTLRDLERIDRETLVFVEKGDAEGLFNNVARDENARNICGLAAIYVMLKVLEPCEAALLGYEQASDEDGSGCVTFAACAVA